MEDLQGSHKSHTNSVNSAFEIKDEPDHRITELFRLEKTLKIKVQPDTPMQHHKATHQRLLAITEGLTNYDQ